MKDIVVINSGGLGRELICLIEKINEKEKIWNIKGFVDENEELHDKEINGYKVLKNLDWLMNQELYVVNAIENPSERKKVSERLDKSKNSFPILIHPSVEFSEYVDIGEGTVICSGCVITTNIEIGRNVIIGPLSTISYDAKIGNYTTIKAGANISSEVTIKDCVYIGTGQVVAEDIGEGKVLK